MRGPATPPPSKRMRAPKSPCLPRAVWHSLRMLGLYRRQPGSLRSAPVVLAASHYRVAQACPACASAATTSTGECRACGHLWGAQHECVHCGANAGTSVDAGLGVLCVACRLPRVVPGWQMPASLAKEVRDAFWARRSRRRLAALSFAVATLCVAAGPLLFLAFGYGAWIAALALWCGALVCTHRLRAQANQRLLRATASAKRRCVEEQSAEPLRVPPESPRLRVADDSPWDQDQASAPGVRDPAQLRSGTC